MNINFELYRIFYVVANHSNITKASEELNKFINYLTKI